MNQAVPHRRTFLQSAAALAGGFGCAPLFAAEEPAGPGAPPRDAGSKAGKITRIEAVLFDTTMAD